MSDVLSRLSREFRRQVPAGGVRVASAFLVAGDVGRRALTALAGVFAFRALSLDDMGALSLAVAIATFLRFVVGGGVPYVLRRDFTRSPDGARLLWSNGLSVVLLSGAACLIVPALTLLLFGSARLAVLLALALAHHVCGAITDCFKSVHISRGLAARATAIDVAVGVGLAVPTALLYLRSSREVSLYAACYAVAGIVGLVVAWLNTSGLPPWTLQPPQAWMDLIRESSPYFLEALIITAYFRLTVVLVYNLDGPAASAMFSTGQNLGLLLGVLPINAGLAALPRIVDAARTSPLALDEVMRLIWRRLVPLGLATTIVACATAHWWLGWILGPKSSGVWIHFLCFGASRMAVFVSVPAIFALDALRRQSLRVRVSATAGISVAVIGLPLLLSFGAVGMSAYLAVLEVAIAVAYVDLLKRNRSLAGSVVAFESEVRLPNPGSAFSEPMK